MEVRPSWFREMRMSPTASERHDRSGDHPTANERLKAEGRRRLHWSVVVSVWIHVAVFVGWPTLEVEPLAEMGDGGGEALELLALGSLAAPLLPTSVPSVPPPSDTEDEEEEDAGDETEAESEGSEGEEGPAPSRDDRWRGAAFDRLAEVAPEVVPAAEAPVDSVEEATENVESSTSADEEGAVRVGNGASELVYERLSEEEMLQLGRLSALRPELALVTPSSWLVVQNPSEVGAFMRSRFGPERTPGTGRHLSVSVWIDERGSVEWAEINRSSGRQDLDRSALELFREVVAFRPAREDGLRVPVAAIFWLTW